MPEKISTVAWQATHVLGEPSVTETDFFVAFSLPSAIVALASFWIAAKSGERVRPAGTNSSRGTFTAPPAAPGRSTTGRRTSRFATVMSPWPLDARP